MFLLLGSTIPGNLERQKFLSNMVIGKEFSSNHNYPNPFSPSTTISFAIPQSSFTTLKVYNILGQEVATLVNEEMKTGAYQVNWRASGNPSGVYLYRLQTGEFTETKQMILSK
jgi:hypothetical protein